MTSTTIKSHMSGYNTLTYEIFRVKKDSKLEFSGGYTTIFNRFSPPTVTLLSSLYPKTRSMSTLNEHGNPG